MVMVYKYVSTGTSAWTVDLGNQAVRLGSIQGFSERAEHAAVGSSQVMIDNPLGTVGHSSDQIIGLQLFTVDETDCPSGNRRLYTGYIGTREYGRGSGPTSSLRTTVANKINATLYDLNTVLGFRVIPPSDATANRPAETVSARLTWILGSDYLTGLLADNGLVVYPTTIGMDPADYRMQRPSNVINDCELAANYFAFVYPDETKTVIASLFFDDANASTAYTTSLRLTNNLADVDNVTTFAVNDDFKLTRSPDDTGSGVALAFANGSVYERRAASEAIYGRRDLIAPNSNVKKSGTAAIEANNFLWVHHNEEDRLAGTYFVPKQYVNNLRAGHRLQVKFTNLPGYTDWTWVRCLLRAPGQTQETDLFYTVALELSPQEPAVPAASILQSVFGTTTEGGGFPSFTNPVTIGSHLVFCIMDRGAAEPGAPNTDGGGGQPTWGDGAWTQLGVGVVELGPDWGDDGAAFFYKVADATNQECWIRSSNATFGCWEIAGGNFGALSSIHKTEQFDYPFAIGTIGNTNDGDVMLGLVGFYEEEPSDNPLAFTFSDGWRTRRYAPAYMDTYSHHPWTWIGDAVGAHTGLTETLTRSYAIPESVPFCGIGLRIPAA